MRKLIYSLFTLLIMLTQVACAPDGEKNSILKESNAPFGAPEFGNFRTEDYKDAFDRGFAEKRADIKAIVENEEAPTYSNTIEALEMSGKTLEKVSSIFFTLNESDNTEAMTEIENYVVPKMTELNGYVFMNDTLFNRIRALYDSKETLGLDEEQSIVLENYYKSFVRGGALLSKDDKAMLLDIDTKLGLASIKFSSNLLADNKAFKLVITDRKELAGLPQDVIDAAAAEDGKSWVFTLDKPSCIPFLQYADNRELRKQLYMAYNTQCIKDNENNNTEIVKKLVNLRLERAQLLGFQTAADYVLTKRMAENSLNVYQLLNQLLEAYTPTAHKEVAEVVALAKELEDEDFELMPWDWAYYSEKLKEKRFNLNEEELRPYFELGKVIEGVFGLATRLYGITFQENPDIPVYHPDVKAYEVHDKDGSFLAVLYTDFHPRASKRSGAWMTSYKEQWKDEKGNSRPHVSVTMNFTKPSEDKWKGLPDILEEKRLIPYKPLSKTYQKTQA